MNFKDYFEYLYRQYFIEKLVLAVGQLWEKLNQNFYKVYIYFKYVKVLCCTIFWARPAVSELHILSNTNNTLGAFINETILKKNISRYEILDLQDVTPKPLSFLAELFL